MRSRWGEGKLDKMLNRPLQRGTIRPRKLARLIVVYRIEVILVCRSLLGAMAGLLEQGFSSANIGAYPGNFPKSRSSAVKKGIRCFSSIDRRTGRDELAKALDIASSEDVIKTELA